MPIHPRRFARSLALGSKASTMQRLRHWFSERHIVAYSVIAANTVGVSFGLRSYLKEQEDAELRRQDNEAMAALDRAAAFSNARLPERSVIELEAYRWRLEAEERQRHAAPEQQRSWAQLWVERRCALDKTAAEMEARGPSSKHTPHHLHNPASHLLLPDLLPHRRED